MPRRKPIFMLLLILTACGSPPRRTLPEGLESAHGLQPAQRAMVALGVEPIAVRARVRDTFFPFIVQASDDPETLSHLATFEPQLDLTRGAIAENGEIAALVRNVPGSVVVEDLSHPQFLISREAGPARPSESEGTGAEDYALPAGVLRVQYSEFRARYEMSATRYAGAIRPDNIVIPAPQLEFRPRRGPEADAQWDETAARVVASFAGDQVLLGNLTAFYDSRPTVVGADTLGARAEEVRAIAEIAWEYIEDGCPSRAHLAVERLRQSEVTPVKVFVEGDLRVERGEETFTWGFHVAAGLLVEDGENVHLEVLDFALADSFLALEEWLSRFAAGPVVVHLMPFWQFSPPSDSGLELESEWDETRSLARTDQDIYWRYQVEGRAEGEGDP